jgi:hypothetical protein
MTAILPPSADCPAPFSQSLLDHDGLMTPVLRAAFGPLTVRQSQVLSGQDRMRRRSSIHQAATGAKILDAVLDIAVQALPEGFLEQLQRQDVLFGQLLQDFSVGVRIADRSLYRGFDGTDLRCGRRLAIYDSARGDFICHVDELLSSEAQLLGLRRQI